MSRPATRTWLTKRDLTKHIRECDWCILEPGQTCEILERMRIRLDRQQMRKPTPRRRG